MDDSLRGLTGRIVIPSNPFYNEARQDYNRAIQQFPMIIDYCGGKQDVSNAVIWSETNHVPLRIRNGGHNYEGYSNGTGVLIIDVSEMTGIKLDEANAQFTVQGGVTNRLVYEFLSGKGYPFPGGTCPTVGVGGYALGGGWGLSCRYLGLGCDSLEEIELVNYKGEIIKASRSCNEDLFWACRGAGGGNFGVIVSMTFRLPEKVAMVTLIEIDYLHVTEKEQEEFLGVWQSWLKNADPRMTLIARIYNSVDDGLAMLARGIFYGKPNEAKQILKSFLALLGAEYSLSYVTFLEAVTVIGSNYPPFEIFQSASRFVPRYFSEHEISKLVGLIQRRAAGSVFAGLSMYALGGRVREVGTDETAFFYRDAHFIIWLETVWEENQFARRNREWVSERFPVLAAATKGSYVNFPYSELPNYLEEYYGAHVSRLEQIKTKYDPQNIFSFPQGIQGIREVTSLPDEAKKWMDEPFTKYPGAVAYRGFRYVKNHYGQQRTAETNTGSVRTAAPINENLNITVNRNRGGAVVFANNPFCKADSWQVFAGSARDRLAVLGTVPAEGEEIKISIRSIGPYFQLKALAENGTVTGLSRIICVW